MPGISRHGDSNGRVRSRIEKDDKAGAETAPGETGSGECRKHTRPAPDPTSIAGLARGTLIRTPSGDTAIEELRAGDLIQTLDRDAQPLRWIGSHSVEASGDHAPVIIPRGTFGNSCDLVVGPGHLLLLRHWRAELMFGEPEVLATARDLAGEDTVHRSDGGNVELFQILLDRHEIVTANGAPAESFHPGEHGLGWLGPEARDAILQCFPQLRDDPRTYGPLARTVLSRHEVRAIQR